MDTAPVPVAAFVPDYALIAGLLGAVTLWRPGTQRRTIGVVTRGLIGRAATTPMARRRPAS